MELDFDVVDEVQQVFICGEIVGKCMANLSKLVADVVFERDQVSKACKVDCVQYALTWQRQSRVLEDEYDTFYSWLKEDDRTLGDCLVYLFKRLMECDAFYGLVEDLFGNFAVCSRHGGECDSRNTD